VQMAKSTQYFELFGGLNPGTVRVSTKNSKDKVILVRCAIFSPATAEFRIMGEAAGGLIAGRGRGAPTLVLARTPPRAAVVLRHCRGLHYIRGYFGYMADLTGDSSWAVGSPLGNLPCTHEGSSWKGSSYHNVAELSVLLTGRRSSLYL